MTEFPGTGPPPYDPETDLPAPAPEAFADLLARTLAELPAEPAPPFSSSSSPAPASAPRHSLIQRILGRRRLSGVAVAPPPPTEEEDVLLLEVEVPAAPEEEASVDDDDDVLLLEIETPPAPEGETNPADSEKSAIPLSLTPASTPFDGGSRPGLLERLFSRHKVEAQVVDVVRYDPPPLTMPPAEPSQGEEEDVMVLDDSFLAPAPLPAPAPSLPLPDPSPEPHPTDVLLRQVFEALAQRMALDLERDDVGLMRLRRNPMSESPSTLLMRDGFRFEVERSGDATSNHPVLAAPSGDGAAAEIPAPADGRDDEDDVLILDDAFLVAAAPPPEPLSPMAMTAGEMAELIAAATPDNAGTLDLPDRIDALAQLLATQSDDFTAQDLLYDCWPRGSDRISSRALLAVAINLSRNFGLPGKLPMAASKAWRMLDPQVFQAALAQRLAAIGDFITVWQRSQFTFLSLEFGEIELIEYLFESLHPGNNIELLASVMNFKVLSRRRLGLLRRVLGNARRIVNELGPQRQEQALLHLSQVRALLIRLVQPDVFPPIMEAAGHALADIEKLMARIASPPPPVADGGRPGGSPLGKL